MFIKNTIKLIFDMVRVSLRGDWKYLTWLTVLFAMSLMGLHAYNKQLAYGLAITGMSDQVSWGFYIANFTFLVGMASAVVVLVIPVYIYRDNDIRPTIIIGEILAIASLIMCLLFVMVDIGRPDRFWHMIPDIGKFNWPGSMLSWDVIVLNGYLALNAYLLGYQLYMIYAGKRPSKVVYIPFIFILLLLAEGVHTVTAFLYVGLGGRPFWNSAIVGPRFLASAFAAGPAFIILALQVIRRFTDYEIKDACLLKLRAIVQISMIVNVFLLACEIFKEFYTDSTHAASAHYLFFGLHGHKALVPWIWTAVCLNITATVLLMIPKVKGLKMLNVACILAIIGIWIEKGIGLVIPAFTPSPLGEIVEYMPSINETIICLAIWAFGFLLFTIMVRMTLAVLSGEIRHDTKWSSESAPNISPAYVVFTMILMLGLAGGFGLDLWGKVQHKEKGTAVLAKHYDKTPVRDITQIKTTIVDIVDLDKNFVSSNLLRKTNEELAFTDDEGERTVCSDCHDAPETEEDKMALLKTNPSMEVDAHERIKVNHGTSQCFNCHNAGNRDTFSGKKGSEITYENVVELCTKCHSRERKYWDGGVHAGNNAKKIKVSCIECHDPHQPKTETKHLTELCARCHGNKYQEWKTGQHSRKNVYFDTHHQRNRSILCVSCHNPHKPKVTEEQASKLCAGCHGPRYQDWTIGAHGRQEGYWDTTKGKKINRACRECHNPHQPHFKPMTPAPAPNYNSH